AIATGRASRGSNNPGCDANPSRRDPPCDRLLPLSAATSTGNRPLPPATSTTHGLGNSSHGVLSTGGELNPASATLYRRRASLSTAACAAPW
ncbi:hypothetical protein BHE74_00051420, partial [Ensete ventricosum]